MTMSNAKVKVTLNRSVHGQLQNIRASVYGLGLRRIRDVKVVEDTPAVRGMGFAVTRAEARQLVSHKAIQVNGDGVNVPSYQCSAGDVIAVREKSKAQARIAASLAMATQVGWPDWVEVDDKKFTGTLKALPERDQILPDINENLVVELYSK